MPGIGCWTKAALLIEATLMLGPAIARGAEFCPPSHPPAGWVLAPGPRVFHGAPAIESLRIGGEAEMPCRASPGRPEVLCGNIRLGYEPWDPYPELASVLIGPQSGRGARSQQLRGRGETAVLIACRSLPVALSSIGERSLRVRTTRELVVTMVEPIKLHRSGQETSRRLVIRESFLSSYPLVRAAQKAS